MHLVFARNVWGVAAACREALRMPEVELAFDPSLVAYCGFYCGGCPTFLAGDCEGCLASHGPGDCYTADCVPARGLRLCGACDEFPCPPLIERPRATVLDPRWLAWKRRAKRMDAWLHDLLTDGCIEPDAEGPGDSGPDAEGTGDGDAPGGEGRPRGAPGGSGGPGNGPGANDGGDGRHDRGDGPPAGSAR